MKDVPAVPQLHANNVQGHMKEAAGKMTDDGELEAEGQRQQAEADRVEQDESETNTDSGA